MQGIVLDNDVFVIEHTLPPHNDVFTAPAAFFHYEGWGVFKSKETLAAQLRIAAVLLRKTGRSRPLFAYNTLYNLYLTNSPMIKAASVSTRRYQYTPCPAKKTLLKIAIIIIIVLSYLAEYICIHIIDQIN